MMTWSHRNVVSNSLRLFLSLDVSLNLILFDSKNNLRIVPCEKRPESSPHIREIERQKLSKSGKNFSETINGPKSQ